MAHEFAQRLDIAARLQAGGGKRVPQGVWTNRPHHCLFEIAVQAFAIAAGFHRLLIGAGQKPDILSKRSTQRTKNGKQRFRNRNLPCGSLCFGRLHHNSGMTVTTANALYRSTNRQKSSTQIKVSPLQTADFANAHPPSAWQTAYQSCGVWGFPTQILLPDSAPPDLTARPSLRWGSATPQ